MVVFKNSTDNMQFFMIPFSKKFPKLKIIRNANNLMEIKVNDDEYLVIEIEPSLRDILALVIRSLLSKAPIGIFKDDIKFPSPGHHRSKTQSFIDPVLEAPSTEETKGNVNKSADMVNDAKSNENSIEIQEVVEEIEDDDAEDQQNQANNDSNEETKDDINPSSNSNNTPQTEESLNDQNENSSKPSIKRQKLATGKKKAKSEVASTVANKENEDKKESNNPFKHFIENISDRSRDFANTVMKEKDEIIAKLNKGKNDPESQTKDIRNYTIKEETAEDHQTQDYLGDMIKISQLSQELTKKTEYLEKAETKIISLKSELNNIKITLSNRESKCKELEAKLESQRSAEKDLNQEISDLKTHINFLQLENTIFNQQRQKL